MSLIINDEYKLKILEALSKESGLSKNKIRKRVNCDSKKTTDSAIRFLVCIKAIREEIDKKIQKRYFHYYILPLGTQILNNIHNKGDTSSTQKDEGKVLTEKLLVINKVDTSNIHMEELHNLEKMLISLATYNKLNAKDNLVLVTDAVKDFYDAHDNLDRIVAISIIYDTIAVYQWNRVLKDYPEYATIQKITKFIQDNNLSRKEMKY